MLRLLFWVVVGLLALSFFGVSLRAIIESPAGQDNLGYVFDLVKAGFDFVLATLAALFAWITNLIT